MQGRPICACDPNTQESILHIILDCPIHTRIRHYTEHKINTDIKHDTISTITEDKNTRVDFFEYCVKVATYAINRNKT